MPSPRKVKRRPHAGGRRKIPIDLDRITRFGAIHSTVTDAARELGIPPSTLYTKLERDRDVREAWEKGEAQSRNAVRHKQLSKALAGDNVMMIWLGKNWLGQLDSPEPQREKEELTYSPHYEQPPDATNATG